ncbi:MAG: DUF5343 domain-containing protein [Chloroflexota bacterium]|nr:DUF5343 domain-containing protein [Chloroflexota bacterium]
MALPTAYLTSLKNVDPILVAIREAQAPPRFTQKFLEGLGFPSASDRLFINVLKSLGMLNETGVPTRRYHEYLDQTQSAAVLADAIRHAYSDLFLVNTKAQDMSATEVKNKMKTLSEGRYSESVLDKMAGTFKALAKHADFSAAPAPRPADMPPGEKALPGEPEEDAELRADAGVPTRIGGLVYSINIQLPESRDPAVYDALFKSLKTHLLR